ncbi:alpha/beta hydrolase [Streptomyces dioscori]|uniref:Alpha/beta hydrolase n=1 Tax=Streptomyces dioscori TaxID=2109333 RepID=A0A2P8QFM6_9ACTN|nr:alpha/beta hydrolase [Streptomyces dioscori]PSM45059.1 alpha/beta hydrolase [Streptomyces dioscori]
MVSYVIIPGIDGSDARHWQSLWEKRWGGSAVRVAPASWSRPELSDWVDAVQTAYESVARHDSEIVLVAHSLGCWTAAEWFDRQDRLGRVGRVRPAGVTAFLVAPPDTRSASFPSHAAPSYVDVTARPLPCRSLLVASDDDPYCDPAASAAFAREWRAPSHFVENHGHINSASGLGDWPAGQELLRTLVDEPTA